MKNNVTLLALFTILSFITHSMSAIAQDALNATEPRNPTVREKETYEESLKKRQFETGEIIISFSEKKDELRGFSLKRGEWSILKLAPQESLDVTASGTMALIRTDDSLVAYSGVSGWWDVIPHQKNSSATINLSDNLVIIQGSEHVYTFTGSNGRWTSSDPQLQPAKGKLKLLANIEAMREISFDDSDPFFRHRNRQIQVSIKNAGQQEGGPFGGPASWFELEIVAGRKSYLDEVIETYKKIELLPAVPEKSPDNASERFPISDSDLKTKIANLNEKMIRFENESILLGKSLASQTTPTKEDRKKLEELVAQSFDARQSMQQLESQRMSLKLAKVNENLTSRQNSRGSIVERRVAELLDPNSETTAWQTSQTELPTLSGRYSFDGSYTEEKAKENRLRWSEKAIWEQLGFRLSVLPASSIPKLINPVDYKGGLRVDNVRSGGPAEGAGVQIGDILVGIRDWQTPSLDSLAWILSNSAYTRNLESKYYVISKGVPRTVVLPTPGHYLETLP
jgi:hypothetical protein